MILKYRKISESLCQILKLKGTSHDFSVLRKIGDEQNLDHSFVRSGRGFGVGAILEDDIKHRRLTVSTTLPDIHVFMYEGSICIEAQLFQTQQICTILESHLFALEMIITK